MSRRELSIDVSLDAFALTFGENASFDVRRRGRVISRGRYTDINTGMALLFACGLLELLLFTVMTECCCLLL